MPRHPCCLKYTDSISYKLINMLEIQYTRVIVILSWKECLGEIGGVCVGKWVIVSVPASEAEVKSTDASIVVVDNDDFLVVRPEFDGIWEGVMNVYVSYKVGITYLGRRYGQGGACKLRYSAMLQG